MLPTRYWALGKIIVQMDQNFWCKTHKITQVREMALGDLKVLLIDV